MPKRAHLLQEYLPDGVELFALLSAADSRPAVTPSALFYSEPGTGDALRDFQRLHLTRATGSPRRSPCTRPWPGSPPPFSGAVTGKRPSPRPGPRFRPLCQEASLRYRQRLQRGLHPGL